MRRRQLVTWCTVAGLFLGAVLFIATPLAMGIEPVERTLSDKDVVLVPTHTRADQAWTWKTDPDSITKGTGLVTVINFSVVPPKSDAIQVVVRFKMFGGDQEIGTWDHSADGGVSRSSFRFANPEAVVADSDFASYRLEAEHFLRGGTGGHDARIIIHGFSVYEITPDRDWDGIPDDAQLLPLHSGLAVLLVGAVGGAGGYGVDRARAPKKE